MKKFVKVFALAVMMIICGQSMAQTRGVMFVGATLPMKDYAKFDGFNEFALTTMDENDAGAGIGFSAGLKWYFNMGVEGLDVMLSIDGMYNGANPDLKAAYRSNEVVLGDQILGGSFKYNSTPWYFNLPMMLGLNYIYHFNDNLGVFVEAGAGGNMRFITEMESVSKGSLLGIETQIRTIEKYDKAFGFTYQAGIGIEVASNLVIGCSFYDLGNAAVKSERIVKTTTLNDNVTNTSTDYPDYGNIHPIMIVGRIGFSF